MKYIIDLDGTLMNSNKPNLDAVKFIGELQENEVEFLIMTNSIKSPISIRERLVKVGMDIKTDNILNPIIAINEYLKQLKINNVFVIGSILEIEQLDAKIDNDNPEMIVLLDFEKENIGYSELQRVFELIDRGIPAITASKSIFYLKDGNKVLDTGSFVKLLENVTEREIKVIGKPSKDYFLAGMRRLNTLPEEVTIVGDDWRTDIVGALNIGCKSVLLKSGKYHQGDENNCDGIKCVSTLMEVL